MNAKELMGQVRECREKQWQNSDIPAGGERLLEIIAAHFEVCEECRRAFDSEEYEEMTLIDLWHRFMCQTEAPDEWICEEGLQALFDAPIGVYLVTIENSEPSEWNIETSEAGAKFHLERKFPGVEFGDFAACEEPEAVENEYVMIAHVGDIGKGGDGKVVARIYTEAD